MQSYYDILGISQNADTDQIKSAFRRLAKLYHPDKNPQGKEQFSKILAAYEILMNTSRRAQYDLKLKHGNTENFKTKKSKQKEWNFSEEELKRRQYYKEHYKKEYERYAKHAHVTKKSYNEYKYILFAAPLAVGLLMFIINTYEQSTGEKEKRTHLVVKSEVKKSELKMGDDPFTSYFKDPVYNKEDNRVLVVKNLSSEDIILALFDEDNKFLRNAAIKPGYEVEISQLPETEMDLKFMSGKDWNSSKEHRGLNVIGGFDANEKYGKINTQNTNGFSLTLDDKSLNALDKITEKEFFKKN